jgi:hypothetical protein
MTSSRAGSPSGKSVFRSASRLISSRRASVRARVDDPVLAFPADPDFALPAARVLAADPFVAVDARPLLARRFVACAD